MPCAIYAAAGETSFCQVGCIGTYLWTPVGNSQFLNVRQKSNFCCLSNAHSMSEPRAQFIEQSNHWVVHIGDDSVGRCELIDKDISGEEHWMWFSDGRAAGQASSLDECLLELAAHSPL